MRSSSGAGTSSDPRRGGRVAQYARALRVHLAGLGRRATVAEVEEYFLPYEPYRGLAGRFSQKDLLESVVDPSKVVFDTGYDKAALASWQIFKQLRDATGVSIGRGGSADGGAAASIAASAFANPIVSWQQTPYCAAKLMIFMTNTLAQS